MRDLKKKCLAILLLTATMLFAGCSNTEQQSDRGKEAVVATTEEKQGKQGEPIESVESSNAKSEDSSSITVDSTQEFSIGAVPLYGENQRSSILLEDEKYFYLCGSCRILKIDKEAKTQEVLWENLAEVSRKGVSLYSEGGGLLIGDKIYYIEHWYEDNWTVCKAFSCISTDGKDYEQLAALGDVSYESMLLQDGVLYIIDLGRVLFYQVFEDGALSAPDETPIDNQRLLYYIADGSRILFPQESLSEFGFSLYSNEGKEVVCENTEGFGTTVIPELGDGAEAFNSKYFLRNIWGDGQHLTLYDKEDIRKKYSDSANKDMEIEGRMFYSGEFFYNVLGMDEEYAYIQTYLYEDGENETGGRCYKRISLESGECEDILTLENTELAYENWQLMDVVIRDGYLYFMGQKDYSCYLMRCKTDGTEGVELVSKECLYETGVSTIGRIESYQEEIYSKKQQDVILYTIDLTWPIVDDFYPGSNLINTYVIEHQNTNIAIAQQNAEDMEQWVAEDGFSAIPYDIQSSFNGYSYFDSHYISFILDEYEYMGGAHGMPYWVPFTFDLETGEKLLILDIINNSEEELKEIVTRYFEEMINQAPENFWQNAVEAVYESTNYESQFYLAEEGIVFYYEPYALACYAAGFQQVTIPYEEFDMAIILDKALK